MNGCLWVFQITMPLFAPPVEDVPKGQTRCVFAVNSTPGLEEQQVIASYLVNQSRDLLIYRK